MQKKTFFLMIKPFFFKQMKPFKKNLFFWKSRVDSLILLFYILSSVRSTYIPVIFIVFQGDEFPVSMYRDVRPEWSREGCLLPYLQRSALGTWKCKQHLVWWFHNPVWPKINLSWPKVQVYAEPAWHGLVVRCSHVEQSSVLPGFESCCLPSAACVSDIR